MNPNISIRVVNSHLILISGMYMFLVCLGMSRFSLERKGSSYRLSWYYWWCLATNAYKIRIHYGDVIMSAMGSQISSVSMVCSTLCSGADQRTHWSKHHVLGLCEGISPVTGEFPHKRPLTRKMFSFDDVIRFSVLISDYIPASCSFLRAIVDCRYHSESAAGAPFN